MISTVGDWLIELAAERGTQFGYCSLLQGERGVYTVSLFSVDPRNDAIRSIQRCGNRRCVLEGLRPGGETVVMLHKSKLFGFLTPAMKTA